MNKDENNIEQQITDEQESANIASNEVETNNKVETNNPIEPKKDRKKAIIAIIIILIIAMSLGALYFFVLKDDDSKDIDDEPKRILKDEEEPKYSHKISGNSIDDFDLYFLKVENGLSNKVYSPLSIKYALAMLNEGTADRSHQQIEKVIGDYVAKKYENSSNMSLANALFIRDSFKSKVKDDYISNLENKFGASVIFDPFDNPDNINKWVSDKTFNLLNNLVDNTTGIDYYLISALAIDMEWENLLQSEYEGYHVNYNHENYGYYIGPLGMDGYSQLTFDNSQTSKSVQIGAVANKYDIIKTLGEDNIRKEVSSEYEKWLSENSYAADFCLDVNSYVNKYIDELKENYETNSSSTDFKFMVNDSVTAFAKDLKEYNGVTLQYVGIMPTNTTLDKYISGLQAKDIAGIISDLKEPILDSYEDGYVTEVNGYIPMFKFDYELQLMKDLRDLGIIDVFDEEDADLSKLTSDKNSYIKDAIHKANIEFSNEGIKASAATALGGRTGAGGGCAFDHMYEVPVKKINLTFDKPYLFLIRDKDTGEVWFTGTVYEPIDGSNLDLEW